MASRMYKPSDPKAARFEEIRKKNLEKPLSLEETRRLREQQEAEGKAAQPAPASDDKE